MPLENPLPRDARFKEGVCVYLGKSFAILSPREQVRRKFCICERKPQMGTRSALEPNCMKVTTHKGDRRAQRLALFDHNAVLKMEVSGTEGSPERGL